MTAPALLQRKQDWELGLFTGLSLGFAASLILFSISGRPADLGDAAFAVLFIILAAILALCFRRKTRGVQA